MRADIHDGPEHNTLQSEAGYIDARPQSRQIDETPCDARPDHTLGQIRPWCSIGVDGSLSPDSFRAGQMTVAADMGPVSRASSVHTVMRNYTGDEGRSFEFDNQVLISSHRKLLWSKAMVVNVAEKSGLDPVRHGRERRA